MLFRSEDAFRGGLDIFASQLDAKDIDELQQYIKETGVIEQIKRSIKWCRLFGGGGIIIDDGAKDPRELLDYNKINKKTPLTFYGADLWELYLTNKNLYAEEKPYIEDELNEIPYNFYGKQMHKSRVFKLIGKDAPSMIRPILRGWGMSELERLVRDLNQYLKNQDVIFELLDEAKIDVYKIKGLIGRAHV